MRRGFLNNPKSKKGGKPLKPDSDDPDKCDAEKFILNSRSDNSNGPIMNLHKLPESLVAKSGRKRFVCREWPRNPEGPIVYATPEGKVASNGLPLWAATLYDFYYVRRMPKNQGYLTISTGSKLATHMQEIGELDWAKDEIDWAGREEDPVEVLPCDIGALIKDGERNIRMGITGKSMERAEQEAAQHSTVEETNQSSAPVFDLCHYPPPWPLVPFSAPINKLQKRIPLHLLPQKLVVHDPRNLLSIPYGETYECVRSDTGNTVADAEWTTQDIIRTYNLQLSESGKERAEKEKILRAELDKDAGQRDSFICIPTSKSSGPVPPAIKVFPPPRPAPKPVPEAHLYLSPAHRSGTGNHSVVYQAEWELPRSMLVEDELCQRCMMDKVAELVQEKQRRGEYTYAIVVGKENPDSSELSASTEIPDPKAGKIAISYEHSPAITVEVISAEEHKADKKDENEDAETGEEANNKGHGKVESSKIYTIQPGGTVRTSSYEGPIVEVFPEVEWQNPERGPYCSHLQASSKCEKPPPTAKVCVAAKLSKPNDKHLEREAKNFQSFPSHLFEHWNGYNVIPPLHDPVPVGAVVPQFYGYYVPEEDDKPSHYLSPILLVEHCGIPIVPVSLNKDDKHECASLIYRLHAAGWNHHSFAERNILVQPGPLSQWPTFRGLQDTLSFRLIDFGRSAKCDANSRASEEREADRMFQVTGMYPEV